jgi:Uma2 family endonuclease
MMTTNLMTVRMFAHALHGDTIRENRPMQMATETRPWTRDELERLPDDGNRYEVVRGELFVTPPPSTRHEEIVSVVADILRRYIEPAKLGVVRLGTNAVVLEDSQVEPDILVRARIFPTPATWDGMPTPFLIVEVLSPSTRRRDLVAKRALYLDAGVAEYWIVDAETRTIRVVRPDTDHVALESLHWHPAGATEPLVLDVAAMFREALG